MLIKPRDLRLASSRHSTAEQHPESMLHAKAKRQRDGRPGHHHKQCPDQVMIRTQCDEVADFVEHHQACQTREQDQGGPAEQHPSDQDCPLHALMARHGAYRFAAGPAERSSCECRPLRRNCQRMARYQAYPAAVPQIVIRMTLTRSSDPLDHSIHPVHRTVNIMAQSLSWVSGFKAALRGLEKLQAILRATPGPHREARHCTSSNPSSKSQPRPLPGPLGFSFAVARRRVGVQRCQQPPRRRGDFRDGAVEGFGVGLRRLVEARKFAHELQRGGLDFILGRRRLEIEQRLDVAAHGWAPLPVSSYRGRFTHLKNDMTAHFVIEWATRSPPCHRARTNKERVPQCLTSPTKSFSMTAAGPIPSMACFPNPSRPMPQRLPPPGAPPPSSACPAEPRRSNTKPPTASGTPKPPPAATVPRPTSRTRPRLFPGPAPIVRNFFRIMARQPSRIVPDGMIGLSPSGPANAAAPREKHHEVFARGAIGCPCNDLIHDTGG